MVVAKTVLLLTQVVFWLQLQGALWSWHWYDELLKTPSIQSVFHGKTPITESVNKSFSLSNKGIECSLFQTEFYQGTPIYVYICLKQTIKHLNLIIIYEYSTRSMLPNLFAKCFNKKSILCHLRIFIQKIAIKSLHVFKIFNQAFS